jgi:D-alanyl-D-alanine carboxypeptidase/D-alanyl-D-alanine-endopeptidase (penicillin-binding protein 4)
MAASKQGPLGDHPYDLARERATKFLVDTVGVDKEDIRIFDGSGMSRHNLVTSRAISKLLLWANRQPTAPLWKSCLVSPLNGTLKGRLKDVDFRGKTGTLDMVVSLSGYVNQKQGHEVIMSCLLNHFTCSSVKARDILDNFAKTLYENASGTWDAIPYNHEARSSISRNLLTDWNWDDRLDRDRRTSRAGQDR